MTEEQDIKLIRQKLEQCARPIFLFDDDPDGLASFLILYRMVRAGKGLPLKGSVIDERMVEKVNNYFPDLVVILDKAEVSQEFIDKIRSEVVWVDHHEVKKRKGVTYLNPRKEDAERNIATSHYAHKLSGKDLWQTVVGIVSDWQLPEKEILDRFRKEYPGYLPADVDNPAKALFETKVGELARIFSFNLKGKTTDVLSSMKILTRIDNPNDLFEKKNAQARLVMKRYEKHLAEYQKIKESVDVNAEDPLLLFTYTDDRNSYTTDLSNELLYEQPEKLILIARQSNGSYKCSLRSNALPVDKILSRVLEEVEGTGGGHEHACGAVIPSENFSDFVEGLRGKSKELKTKNS
ncbi:MAG: DHHA1 domain-containing protein [Candidatus Woesearchaeota archaeon]